MAAPYSIRVSSQKGGVGKTTIAINMAIAFSMLKYKTLIIDADLANPNVAISLGITGVKCGLMEAILNKCSLKEAIRIYDPAGLYVLPCLPTNNPPVLTPKQTAETGRRLDSSGFDFVIIDTSPGILYNGILKFYSEVLIVSTPDTAAVNSSIRLAKHFDSIKLKNNFVINRYANKKNQLSISSIEDIYEKRAVAVLPEDEIVPNSLIERIPAFMLNKNAKFCVQLLDLVKSYGI